MVQRTLRITVDGGAEIALDELESLTGGLRADLLETGLDAVDTPVGAEPPHGAKAGTAGTVGVLIATGVFSASTMKAVASVIQSWLQRSGARSVTLERGEERIVLTGSSQADVDALVRHWIDVHSPDARDSARE